MSANKRRCKGYKYEKSNERMKRFLLLAILGLLWIGCKTEQHELSYVQSEPCREADRSIELEPDSLVVYVVNLTNIDFFDYTGHLKILRCIHLSYENKSKEYNSRVIYYLYKGILGEGGFVQVFGSHTTLEDYLAFCDTSFVDTKDAGNKGWLEKEKGWYPEKYCKVSKDPLERKVQAMLVHDNPGYARSVLGLR